MVCAVLESGVVPGGEIARNVSVALGMQTVMVTTGITSCIEVWWRTREFICEIYFRSRRVLNLFGKPARPEKT